jgi:hypothetical protein
MRPNLALGPIDSIAQYLLYVSIVVLGVVLPILVQKWRQRRQDAALARRTGDALRDELATNRRRLAKTRDSFRTLESTFESAFRHHERLWHHLGPGAADGAAPEPFERPEIAFPLPVLPQTAWDVAHVSNALALVPPELLVRFTRAYSLQRLLGESLSLQMDVAARSAALDAPTDLADRANVASRLQVLAVSRAVARNQIILCEAALDAYDAALAGTADPST